MAFAWAITKDHLDDEVLEHREVLTSPWDTIEDIEGDDNHTQFKLYDDDDILYFEGVYVEDDKAGSEDCFAPLDWAMADSGCTCLKYKDENGDWEVL